MKTQNTFYSRYGKRWFDLLLTVPGLVVISPALLMIALLIKYRLGSPVLFKQVRPGLHGKPFTLYKFRTMTDASDKIGKAGFSGMGSIERPQCDFRCLNA